MVYKYCARHGAWIDVEEYYYNSNNVPFCEEHDVEVYGSVDAYTTIDDLRIRSVIGDEEIEAARKQSLI